MKYFYIITMLLLLYCTKNFAQFNNIFIDLRHEVAITINPTNPLNLIAASNTNFYVYTLTGDFGWSGINYLSSTMGVAGDPSLTFDYLGNAYYAHLSNTGGTYGWLDRMVVQKSINGGVTWNNGTGVGLNGIKDQDKEWIVSDMVNTSSYKGSLYMGWTEFDKYGSSILTDESKILFSFSRDTNFTWNTPIQINDMNGYCRDNDSTVEGAVPAIGPNGEIYISWSSLQGIMFDKSLDGGQTFGTDIVVASQPGGWAFDIPGISRCNGFPVTLCDASTGDVHIVWSDQRNGITNTDIFSITSHDGGNTWGNIVRVNNDTSGRHQFFPWATIDQSTGNIYVVFYDRRNTVGDSTDVYLARSTDGGVTFDNFKISNSSFLPYSNRFFGDYTNIAALNGKIYPIWMQMLNSSGEINVIVAPIEDSQLLMCLPNITQTDTTISSGQILTLRGDTVNIGAPNSFTVLSGGNADITAGTVVKFNEGVSIHSGATLSAVISPCDVQNFTGGTNKNNAMFVKKEQEKKKRNVQKPIPKEYSLSQAYPNPFNPTTTIKYNLPEATFVTLKIYNVLGQEVATLVNEQQPLGYYSVNWNASSLPTGMYIYRITAGKFSQSKKMQLVK